MSRVRFWPIPCEEEPEMQMAEWLHCVTAVINLFFLLGNLTSFEYFKPPEIRGIETNLIIVNDAAPP